MGETVRPRWFTEFGEGHADWYIDRFRRLAAEGADLAGEARFVDALVAPRSRILDAGCGPGRTAAVLHERGHDVLGVDVDPQLVAAARADHPGPRWLVADLATLDLDDEPFDAAVLAGNVMVFVAPGSEERVLTRVSTHVRPGGVVVTGFALDRAYSLGDFDRDCDAAGLRREHRFAGWDLAPWRDDATWAVTVLRRP
ncbi:Methyltransferase domain-containing protein [Jatrophihabitans endophyticus]|uniref:Methyltransferase domain-containing protein n=1 Tax=Jatrophihabitans endophyticus TaxID=1206085 RepID=A0A1M5LFL4_9ACTN|nr:class I SAM-dependent methyltransferase [Jatrophihabitans endophyticus]SHG63837.1 Methyltransferase domain-containing protein [Jatrophihabitans endophyticus]